MSSRRQLSWTTALQNIRADRTAIPAGFLGARARIEFTARTRRPLVVAGAFDRSAIMAAAASAAKSHQERYGSTWAVAMSIALRGAWQVAKAAYRTSAH